MQLTEKYRPATLSTVVGQASTIHALKTLIGRGMHSTAIYLHGPSGTGKTTIARALVNELNIAEMDLTTIGGADCLKSAVQDVIGNFSLSAWGDSQWKAVIVDECHAMSDTAVQCWLPYLESLPPRRLVIFTTTRAPKTDLYGEFSEPMLSRCKVFELSADRQAFAIHASMIASAEHLNGQPIEAYRGLIEQCGGNLRAALQKIESGFMLVDVNVVQLPKPPADIKAIAAGGTQSEVDAEIEFGKKFFVGSKKHGQHLARLEALRTKL